MLVEPSYDVLNHVFLLLEHDVLELLHVVELTVTHHRLEVGQVVLLLFLLLVLLVVGRPSLLDGLRLFVEFERAFELFQFQEILELLESKEFDLSEVNESGHDEVLGPYFRQNMVETIIVQGLTVLLLGFINLFWFLCFGFLLQFLLVKHIQNGPALLLRVFDGVRNVDDADIFQL